MESVLSFAGRGVSITRPVIKYVPFRVGGEFLVHTPCLNRSDRTSDGESILHAPFWHLSLRSSVEESLLHAPRRSLSSRIVVGEFLVHPGTVIFPVLKRVESFSYPIRVSSFVSGVVSPRCSVIVTVLG